MPATQRYFMQLSYNGAPFHGWQTQPNAITVQQTIEEAMATVLRRQVAITGAGRTDAGVNARKMMAHFDLPADLLGIGDDKIEPFVRAINHLCGHDIAIKSVFPVKPDAHARFDATSRTYKYFMHYGKSPFLKNFSWQIPRDGLDLEAMNLAAELLLDVDDFTSFSKLHTDVKTNICHVTQAEIYTDHFGMAFTITADRFLRNMVRAIFGTLVDVGRGKLSIDGFRRVIDARDRCEAGTSMPPHPLFLWDITYPNNIFPDSYE
ncbi:MAG: tRNA pseudouridine(38-40) synthase TruA [Muribaculaceae bacterium]|nr:tRNA pseudouridine(38-40) synthase TruA [Muribaculaceae bacterium]